MSARREPPDRGYMVLTGFSCHVCGHPLHPALVADGFSTHPCCGLREERRP